MNLMLQFAEQHHITPWVEEGRLDLKGIQDGVDRLKEGSTRYRFNSI
jgi:D-arabinose 1-dehydrogenase-like Zn-dependent alcohol dehydrogenase